MHKTIDKVIECRRPLQLRFGDELAPRKVKYNKGNDYFDSDTDSDDDIRLAKERLSALSPRLVTSESPQLIDYDEQIVPKSRVEKAIDLISKRATTATIYKTGPKSGIHLNRVQLGESNSALTIDDTYEFRVVDPTKKEIIQNFPMTSTQVKCTYVAEEKLFFGMAFGAVWMYNAFDPYERVGHVQTFDKVAPTSMSIVTSGALIVGLVNGSVEMFKFGQSGIRPAYELGQQSPRSPSGSLSPRLEVSNQLMIPQAGEVYDITVVDLPVPANKSPEIALATFGGLIFGRISNLSDGFAFGRYQRWETTKEYLKTKMISQICQFGPGKFLVAEYSQPGYYIIERTDD